MSVGQGSERIPDHVIDAVKDAVNLVAIASDYTKLRRTGREHVGRCPLHDERSASFSINARKGVFYCFGCQARGDAIDFIRRVEGLDFTPAIELLAARYGIDVECPPTSERTAVRQSPRKRRSSAERIQGDIDGARRDGKPMQAWEAWLALGGSIPEALALRTDPLGEARSWIEHRRWLATLDGDLDLDMQLARALGLEPQPWFVWTSAAVGAALRDAYEAPNIVALLAALDVLNAIDEADARRQLRALTDQCGVLLARLVDESESDHIHEQAA